MIDTTIPNGWEASVNEDTYRVVSLTAVIRSPSSGREAIVEIPQLEDATLTLITTTSFPLHAPLPENYLTLPPPITTVQLALSGKLKRDERGIAYIVRTKEES